jgi:CheY-like chemotaxis protein
VERPAEGVWQLEDGRLPILFVEDAPEVRLIYENYLRGSVFQMIPAASLRDARDVMRQIQPMAIVLDVLLRGEDSWQWLVELKANPATRDIPVVVVTTVEDQGKGYALGADEYIVKPVQRQVLLSALERVADAKSGRDARENALKEAAQRRVLIIDDEATARYILAKLLQDLPCIVRQAKNGTDGLRMAKEVLPDLILLDLNMPDISGFTVLDQIRADPATRTIPVAIVTSLSLNELDRKRLQAQACGILNKSELSRDQVQRLLTEAWIKPVDSVASIL